MRDYRFIISFIALTVAQVFVSGSLGLMRYAVLSVLPALILMLPVRYKTVPLMLIAFALGFLVDFFSTGLLGINSLALVPVALVRHSVLSLTYGDDLLEAQEELALSRFGLPRFLAVTLELCAIYIIIYVWADSAGTISFWNAALRVLASLAVSVPACLGASQLLRP